jgi:hypothetical protein
MNKILTLRTILQTMVRLPYLNANRPPEKQIKASLELVE